MENRDNKCHERALRLVHGDSRDLHLHSVSIHQKKSRNSR